MSGDLFSAGTARHGCGVIIGIGLVRRGWDFAGWLAEFNCHLATLLVDSTPDPFSYEIQMRCRLHRRGLRAHTGLGGSNRRRLERLTSSGTRSTCGRDRCSRFRSGRVRVRETKCRNFTPPREGPQTSINKNARQFSADVRGTRRGIKLSWKLASPVSTMHSGER
jgi:hypothetical protein